MSHRDVFTNYLLLYRPLINALNNQLANYGLFSSQWGIIRLLKEAAPLTFQEIAKAIHIEKPSASNLIHKLIALGYVEAIEGSDKRAKLVQLTAMGKKVHGEIDKTINEWSVSIVKGISEDEQVIVTRALNTMKKNLLE